MSKIKLEDLKKAAFEKDTPSDEKMQRIAECKKKLQLKLDEMVQKYFDPNWNFSINNSLMRGCQRNDGASSFDVYMNFDRADFSGWNTFVPYKADQNGNNYNARPPNCIRRFLEYAQENLFLPGNITFNVWGNLKCTVVFTILFEEDVEGKTEKIDQNNQNDTSNDTSNEGLRQERIVPHNATQKYKTWAQTVSNPSSSYTD